MLWPGSEPSNAAFIESEMLLVAAMAERFGAVGDAGRCGRRMGDIFGVESGRGARREEKKSV